MKRVYLDYAAATPLSKKVQQRMHHTQQIFANAQSLHQEGTTAQRVLADAYTTLARQMQVRPQEIRIVSGGTYADTRALLGVIFQYPNSHVIISSIEHPAVRETVRLYASRNLIRVTELPVNEMGVVAPETLRDALTPDTSLVSIGSANSEIGTMQPITELLRVIRQYKKSQGRSIHTPNTLPLFHTDAAQSFPFTSFPIGVDLYTANAAKCYGPRMGLLYIREGTQCAPLAGHEGTPDTTAVIGAITAFIETIEQREKEVHRLRQLQEWCIHELQKLCGDTIIFIGHPTQRLPNHISFLSTEFDSEVLLLYLDAQGVAVSAKTACQSETGEDSYVLEAIGQEAYGALRITFGRETTKKDIQSFLRALNNVIDILRKNR